MSRRVRGRPVNGLVILDKPVVMGSNEVLQVVKRLFNARKAGHTGSLDRLASGLLPICLGEATKISGFLLNSDKRYEADVRLGIRTNTGDAEGKTIQTAPVKLPSSRKLGRVLEGFIGEIEQVPPMHSAIKYKGQRLYKLAHQGLVVERQPRRVRIYELDLLGTEPELLTINVKCSKGTYIRTLAEDIGESLGCGAHVERLRRLEAGPFVSDDMISLERLRDFAEEGMARLDSTLLPMEAAVSHWPQVSLPEAVSYYLRQGQPVMVPHAPTEGWVRIYVDEERFIGVGEVLDDGRIAPRRLVSR